MKLEGGRVVASQAKEAFGNSHPHSETILSHLPPSIEPSLPTCDRSEGYKKKYGANSGAIPFHFKLWWMIQLIDGATSGAIPSHFQAQRVVQGNGQTIGDVDVAYLPPSAANDLSTPQLGVSSTSR